MNPTRTDSDSGEASCPRCERLQAEVEVLRAQVTALEAEMRRSRRQAAPFSRGEPKTDPKPPGRRKGQGEFRHRTPPVEEESTESLRTLHAPLPGCPDCGGALLERTSHAHWQVDLPEGIPAWTRFLTESGTCVACGTRVRSRHPAQISTATGAAGVSVGPRAKALAADLKHRLGVPYAKISDLFRTGFGLEVTPSALCQADARLADKAEPLYRELKAAVREALAVHVDETGWRIGGLSAWLWVFTGERITVYTIEPGRGHGVVLGVLGREFRGVLTADCFTAYDHHALADWIQQKCFAHLLKDLARLEREKTGGAVRFPRAVAALFRDALRLKDELPTLDTEVFRRRWERIKIELDRLIAQARRLTDPENARFAKRLRKQREHLFTFLEYDGVDATNNAAERALRPAVITRKTGGCNKTAAGARTHAVLASVLVTLQQQGRGTLDYLCSVLQAPGVPPPLLASPGPDPS